MVTGDKGHDVFTQVRALLVMHITISLARNVTNELVAGCCITERVKRLAGNEIELGIGYRRSDLGLVTYR